MYTACGITSGDMLNLKGRFAQLLCDVLCEFFLSAVLHSYGVIDYRDVDLVNIW